MERPILRTLLPVLTALALAAGLVPLTARPACACTIKHTAYRAAMKSDLRNLVTAQEMFFADSGRYAAVPDLVAMGLFRFSPSVRVAESSVSDSAYTVRSRHEDLAAETTCTVSVGNGAEPDGEPVCSQFPRERAHIRNGIIFFVLLTIALALRVGAAATGHVRFLSWRLLLLPLLAIAHPFWNVIEGRVIDHCDLVSLDILWLGLAAATAGYLFYAPEPPRAKADPNVAA